MNPSVILKRFEQPDEVRVFPKGRFEIIRLGGVTLGRATYEPGWKWSADVGAQLGAARCEVEHIGWVVSGVATAAFRMARSCISGQASYSTFPPFPTIAGWWGRSPMYRYTFWAPSAMLRSEPGRKFHATRHRTRTVAAGPSGRHRRNS